METHPRFITAQLMNLSSSQENVISRNPHMIIHMNYSIYRAQGMLSKISLSQKMVELLNYPKSSCMYNYKDFEVFSGVHCSNWIRYYEESQLFMAAKNTNELIWDLELLYINHSKRKKQPGVIHWYKSVKYENNFFKAKIYFVLVSPRFSRE